MISFDTIFHETLHSVHLLNKSATLCLLGPDMQQAFEDHRKTISMWQEKKLLETVKPGDLGIYNGIRLRKMNCHGMAMVTAPQPGSGFD